MSHIHLRYGYYYYSYRCSHGFYYIDLGVVKALCPARPRVGQKGRDGLIHTRREYRLEDENSSLTEIAVVLEPEEQTCCCV